MLVLQSVLALAKRSTANAIHHVVARSQCSSTVLGVSRRSCRSTNRTRTPQSSFSGPQRPLAKSHGSRWLRPSGVQRRVARPAKIHRSVNWALWYAT